MVHNEFNAGLWKYHARLVQVKKKSIFLSWDKDFIALPNKSIQIMRYIYIFSLFLKKYML